MIGTKRISLIVPCKNEERIIGAFIRRVPRYVDEIIVVDNNSSDNSANVARSAGAIVIRETRNVRGIGYGYAHQAGLKRATGDYIVAMDSDDTYPVRSIRTIIRNMESSGTDFMSCNRLPLLNPKAISIIRRFGIWLLNTETRVLYGYPIHDILTGMWIMNRHAKSNIRPVAGDWNYSPEIKLEAILSKTVTFGEFHIDHFERKNAVSKQNLMRTGMMHAWYILLRRFTTDSMFIQFIGDIATLTKQKIAYTYTFFL